MDLKQNTHTAEVSPCGCVEAQDLVKLYKDEGYDGIVITDHYYLRYFKELGAISWYNKINSYLLGYYKTKEVGINMVSLCRAQCSIISHDLLDGVEVYNGSPRQESNNH